MPDYDDNKALVYVKEYEKREWLIDILDNDDLTIETLDAIYEDIDSLNNLDVTNALSETTCRDWFCRYNDDNFDRIVTGDEKWIFFENPKRKKNDQNNKRSTIATKGMLLRKFEQVYGFPNVIGTIDGIHIKICAPKEDSDLYINRKGFHSMNVQVVCESHELFIYCYAGYLKPIFLIILILLEMLHLGHLKVRFRILLEKDDRYEEEIKPILHDIAVELGNAKRIIIMNTLRRKM
ncbi:Putative nuclease HARBI1 [Atta colombica]|uniref:Putative nuclease HARBI1 n=1 Tax=Atta colombica TaxID=520822 RepID=A0A151I430_9HYME|nr:Putative nuclease HARBI1 [Atta colombica]